MQTLADIEMLLAGRGLVLRPLATADAGPLYQIFRQLVEVGGHFSYGSSSWEEFQRQFLGPASQLFVCKRDDVVIGGFYIRPNDSARNVANAGYMLAAEDQGQGLGRLLVMASLQLAWQMGYQAMQYNRVLSQNQIAVSLYRKLGFEIVSGPNAVLTTDGSHQDCYIMYRQLGDQI
jgi:L-amino acid N-acyltransferase YncA